MEYDKLFIQRKMNKFGGYYYNGKPLDLEIRKEIIRQLKDGIGITQIGRNLQISHGAVSKIVQNYRATHSIEPKVRGSPYERKTFSPKKNDLKFSVNEMLRDNVSQKCRNNFTKEQIAVLKEYFEISPVPDQAMRDEITKKTGLTDKQILTWFNNRRSRVRKSLITKLTSPSTSETSCVTSANSPCKPFCSEKSVASTQQFSPFSLKNSHISSLTIPTTQSLPQISPLLFPPLTPQLPLFPSPSMPNMNAMLQLQQLLTAQYYLTTLMQQFPQK